VLGLLGAGALASFDLSTLSGAGSARDAVSFGM